MASEWVPVVTSIATSVVTATATIAAVVVTQRASSRKDREQKAIELEHYQLKLRDDFQRKTLLQMQAALMKFGRISSQAYFTWLLKHRETGVWRGVQLSEELNQANLSSLVRVQVLKERILDSELRMRIEDVISSTVAAMTAPTIEEAKRHVEVSTMRLNLAHSRMGDVLRGLLGTDPGGAIEKSAEAES